MSDLKKAEAAKNTRPFYIGSLLIGLLFGLTGWWAGREQLSEAPLMPLEYLQKVQMVFLGLGALILFVLMLALVLLAAEKILDKYAPKKTGN